MSHWSKSLSRIGACLEAREFCASQPSRQAAWDACQRADWLLYALGKSHTLTGSEWRLLACALARTALPYAGRAREICERTIETAERFARGEATLYELRAAASATDLATDRAADRATCRALGRAAWHALWTAAQSACEFATWSLTARVVTGAATSAAESAAAASLASITAYHALRSQQCDVIRAMFPVHRLPALKKRKKRAEPVRRVRR